MKKYEQLIRDLRRVVGELPGRSTTTIATEDTNVIRRAIHALQKEQDDDTYRRQQWALNGTSEY